MNLKKIMGRFDSLFEGRIRSSARSHGRRSFLSKAGLAVVGTGAMPLLPFDRSAKAQAEENNSGDEASCDYWRYCALDGNLCATAGGTLTSCPPGSEASKVSWVGTCLNPFDQKNYLVSYNDCCGKAIAITVTECLNSKGERPGYKIGLHNDVNWCMANEKKGYYCTVAMVVGIADE